MVSRPEFSTDHRLGQRILDEPLHRTPERSPTKYRVEPGFYNATLHTLSNLKKWNSLTQAQRDLLSKVTPEFEARSEPDSPELKAALKKQNDWTLSKGLKPIVFTGADSEKWQSAAITEGWKEVFDRSPEHGAKLKTFFSK